MTNFHQNILLSVIIPTRNRGYYVGDLLESLSGTIPVPFAWEVVVVDNGSTDNTAEIVRIKQNSLPIQLRYVMEPHPGLHEGRHRGAAEARGEYLAYLDDDMTVCPTWLNGVQPLLRHEGEAVVGRVLPKWVQAPPAWLAHMCKGKTFGYFALLDLGENQQSIECFFGGNLFIPRNRVFDLGGFHPDGFPTSMKFFRGDGESGLYMKFLYAGFRLVYEPSATAYHIISPERMTLKYLKSRAYNQGISDSFTDIRLKKGLYTFQRLALMKHVVRRFAKRLPIVLYAQYLYSLARSKCLLDRESAKVNYELNKSWLCGYNAHRDALSKVPELMDHVVRPSFLRLDKETYLNVE
jgi:glycosyltransferase involved in cell wall biosynthesis